MWLRSAVQWLAGFFKGRASGAGDALQGLSAVSEYERRLAEVDFEVAAFNIRTVRIAAFHREEDREAMKGVMLACTKSFRTTVYAPIIAVCLGRDLTIDGYFGWIVQVYLEVLYGQRIAAAEMREYKERFIKEYTDCKGEVGNTEVFAVVQWQFRDFVERAQRNDLTPGEAEVWEWMKGIMNLTADELPEPYWGKAARGRFGRDGGESRPGNSPRDVEGLIEEIEARLAAAEVRMREIKVRRILDYEVEQMEKNKGRLGAMIAYFVTPGIRETFCRKNGEVLLKNPRWDQVCIDQFNLIMIRMLCGEDDKADEGYLYARYEHDYIVADRNLDAWEVFVALRRQLAALDEDRSMSVGSEG